MWRIIFLAITQSVLLAGAQVFLKVALGRLPHFGWNKEFWWAFLIDWPLAISGVHFILSSILWIHIVKEYPLSIAYPMISLTFVFGMLAAALFFHEQVTIGRWIGVGCIMLGCFLIAK
ncbi:MAG: EamA family transporter [Muribaculaceae bacterium]|nr:EamA family transporter [Muribaculaceae bacterium]